MTVSQSPAQSWPTAGKPQLFLEDNHYYFMVFCFPQLQSIPDQRQAMPHAKKKTEKCSLRPTEPGERCQQRRPGLCVLLKLATRALRGHKPSRSSERKLCLQLSPIISSSQAQAVAPANFAPTCCGHQDDRQPNWNHLEFPRHCTLFYSFRDCWVGFSVPRGKNAESKTVNARKRLGDR